MPEYIQYSNGVDYKYGATPEELEFFKNHPEEEPFLEGVVRLYVYCKLYSQEPEDQIKGASLEDVYRHIYGNDGCRSCRAAMRQVKAVASDFYKSFRKRGRTVFLPTWRLKCDWELKYCRNHPGMGKFLSCMLGAFWRCWNLRDWRINLDDRVLRGWAKRPTVDDIHEHVFGRKGFGVYHLETRKNPKGCVCCLREMDELIGKKYKHRPEIIKKYLKIKDKQLGH